MNATEFPTGRREAEEGLHTALEESEAMLEAAVSGDWDRLVRHQLRCRTLVEAVCSERGWDADILEKIRGHHGRAIELVRTARDEAAVKSVALTRGGRAVRAYGGHSQ